MGTLSNALNSRMEEREQSAMARLYILVPFCYQAGGKSFVNNSGFFSHTSCGRENKIGKRSMLCLSCPLCTCTVIPCFFIIKYVDGLVCLRKNMGIKYPYIKKVISNLPSQKLLAAISRRAPSSVLQVASVSTSLFSDWSAAQCRCNYIHSAAGCKVSYFIMPNGEKSTFSLKFRAGESSQWKTWYHRYKLMKCVQVPSSIKDRVRGRLVKGKTKLFNQ